LQRSALACEATISAAAITSPPTIREMLMIFS
jgi:hypothetical protein